MDLRAFIAHLKWAEGVRYYPYRCSAGKLTIGVGRNLDDVGITDEEVETLLQTDVKRVVGNCRKLAYWDTLDPVRQLVIADMVFNLGYPRFTGFKRLNAAMEVGDYDWAAEEMINSRWYQQVGRRAVRLVEYMRTGELPG